MAILCYGDSNTFGYDPRGFFGDRYDHPWPELLEEMTGFSVRNCGFCGRVIPRCEVVFPGDADLLIFMLGTNDLLQGATAALAGERMGAFLCALDKEKILLLAPPPMTLGEWVTGEALLRESRNLSRVYRQLAGERGIHFLDAADWEIPMAYDGVHFTEEGHRRFAQRLKEALVELRT